MCQVGFNAFLLFLRQHPRMFVADNSNVVRIIGAKY